MQFRFPTEKGTKERLRLQKKSKRGGMLKKLKGWEIHSKEFLPVQFRFPTEKYPKEWARLQKKSRQERGRTLKKLKGEVESKRGVGGSK
jgi:hypothetical protein